MKITNSREKSPPEDQWLPVGKLALYGFQHVLAFFAGGAIVIPIIVANAVKLTDGELVHLINAALLTCGIASLLQAVGVWKIGARLPLLQGIAFAAVAPLITITMSAGGGTNGLRTAYGAIIVCGILTFALAPLFGKIVKFFPPLVTGSVLALIGLSLLPEAAKSAVGGEGSSMAPSSAKNLAYALGTLGFIVLANKLFKGFVATVSVLLSIALGTTVAWALGDTTFNEVGSAHVVGVTMPFQFGTPQFSIGPIITMMVVIVITSVETTGAIFAVSEIIGRKTQDNDISKAMRADGLSVALGGLMNSFPYTSFSENVGLVRLTRVKSRWVVAAAGVFMVVLGLFPKFSAILTAIPDPVLGGASLAMFGMVTVVGIELLSKVDFHDQRNSIIVAASLGVGMYVTAQPDVKNALPGWASLIFDSGITAGAATAIVLNVIFHHIVGPRRRVQQTPIVSEESGSANGSQVREGHTVALD